VSQGTGFLNRSGIARRLWPFGERFRNSKDKRDFMAAGAASGVAAAFGAPIGGLLFVFEDVASFWTKEIGWSVFYTCAASVFSTAVVDAVFAGSNLRSGILFEVTRPVRAHVLASVLAVFIGLVAGIAAAAFTAVTLFWDRAIRSRVVGHHRRRRLLEPCIYALLFLTLAIVLPTAFPCRESGCVVAPSGGLMCKDGSRIAQDLYGDTTTAGGLRERAVEESVEFYTCGTAVRHPFAGPPTAISASIPGTGIANATQAGGTPVPESAPLLRKYNELASLMLVSGEDAIRHLFSRGTHLEFGYGALATFFVVYGTFAALTAGSSISSGLLIPMLLLGASLGRFCGVLSVNMATRLGYSVVDLLATDEWAWIDPGVFAVVGAAAFLGGGLRQALSVTVIVMEMTSEVHFLLPIMVATAVAKFVSEMLLPHGLYHAILRARRAPFLPSEPPAELAARLEVTSVRHIMSAPVVCVSDVGPLSQAMAALRRGAFHGFPVVSGAPDHALVGLISREHLRRVVARALETRPGITMQPLTYPELEGRADRSGRRPAAWPPEPEDEVTGGDDGGGLCDDATPLLDVPSPRLGIAAACVEGIDGVAINADSSAVLDLRPYMNRSVLSLPVDGSVQRSYVAFRTLGLRHAPVVNQSNQVVGILARAELLPERLSSLLELRVLRN
jgi:chloride channel 7